MDIGVHSDYLPYISDISCEQVHNNISVQTGNRLPDDWNDKSQLPEGWINEIWCDDDTLPEGWIDPTNGEDRNDDDALPEGWKNATYGEGWKNDNTLPDGWRSKIHSNNITIKRNNKYLLASHLPTIFVTNHRSFFPKFHNFTEVMKTLNLTLGLHSEIWEDCESKAYKDKIEEALELQGIQYISNTRPNRRGGGAAISLISGEFSLTRLDVLVPKNLEVVWGLVKPVKPTADFKGIIVCSFYSVPNSRRKTRLIEHIAINYTELKTKHKNCFFLAGGDKNELDARKILDISSTLHMHNTKPTHEKKYIDVLISDMVHLFSESVVIPNVPTDIPDGQKGGGKASDHKIVYCEPRVVTQSKPSRRMVIKKTRRVDDEKKRKLAAWVQQETWEDVYDSNNMAQSFSELVETKINKICPMQEVKILHLEGKHTSLALQGLVRQKKREYEKHGCSKRFKEIKKKVKDRVKKEAETAVDKMLENAEGQGMKWVHEANRLSARPGEDMSP